MKNFRDFIASKNVHLAAVAFGVLFLALLIFHAGVVFGSHRGPFNRPEAEREFRSPFFPGNFAFPHGFIPNTHGAVGTVTALTLPTFTMETREGVTKTILVSTSTAIRSAGPAEATALSKGDQVIILGELDSEGRIAAKLIRILPAP